MATVAPPDRSASPPRRARRRGVRARARRVVQRGHRWLALALGLLVAVVVLSGVAVLFVPETERLVNPGSFQPSRTSEPITPEQARLAVERHDPGFGAEYVVRSEGVYDVYRFGADPRTVQVDPGTGRVLGEATYVDGILGFLQNLHLCALSCEGYPGHLAFMGESSGAWEMTWAAWVLGVAGVGLLLLSLSGLWLWWPGVKAWARGLQVRRRGGSYKRDHDLHKLAGFVALPFLLMWAFTGAAWELPVLRDAWYAVTPGTAPAEYEAMTSKPRRGASVSPEEAERIALRAVPGSEPVSVSVPDRSEPTSAYEVSVSVGTDVYEHAAWKGNVSVGVDRYGGEHRVVYDASQRSIGAANLGRLFEGWQWGLHTGTFASWPWRVAVYATFGLVPLLLAFTGLRMWRFRRAKRRAKLA